MGATLGWQRTENHEARLGKWSGSHLPSRWPSLVTMNTPNVITGGLVSFLDPQTNTHFSLSSVLGRIAFFPCTLPSSLVGFFSVPKLPIYSLGAFTGCLSERTHMQTSLNVFRLTKIARGASHVSLLLAAQKQMGFLSFLERGVFFLNGPFKYPRHHSTAADRDESNRGPQINL